MVTLAAVATIALALQFPSPAVSAAVCWGDGATPKTVEIGDSLARATGVEIVPVVRLREQLVFKTMVGYFYLRSGEFRVLRSNDQWVFTNPSNLTVCDNDWLNGVHNCRRDNTTGIAFATDGSTARIFSNNQLSDPRITNAIYKPVGQIAYSLETSEVPSRGGRSRELKFVGADAGKVRLQFLEWTQGPSTPPTITEISIAPDEEGLIGAAGARFQVVSASAMSLTYCERAPLSAPQ